MLRLFTSGEIDRAARSGQRDVARAISFAVKEATSKALGTGINGRVGWLDIEYDDRRPEEVSLTGGARRRALWLSRPLGDFRAHLHLWIASDTVTATVLLEGGPRTKRTRRSRGAAALSSPVQGDVGQGRRQ